jgi:hypothetical protein
MSNSIPAAQSADTCSVNTSGKRGVDERCGNRFGYQRPKFDLAFAILALGLLTIWAIAFPFHNWGSRVILGIVGLTYLFGCPRTRQSTLWVFGCLYIPWIWVLLTEEILPPNFELDLLADFFVLPGNFVTNQFFDPIQRPPCADVISSLVSAAAFLIPVTIARIYSHYQVALGIIITLMSVAASFGTYFAFLD